jgi:hypothetical protein
MSSSFDDKAREQLSAHQPEVDIAAIWGNLEPAVDALNEKRRKRRLLAWWFFGLASLGLAAGLLWWLSPRQLANQAEVQPPQAVSEQTLALQEFAAMDVSEEAAPVKAADKQQNLPAAERLEAPASDKGAQASSSVAPDDQQLKAASEQTLTQKELAAMVVSEETTPAEAAAAATAETEFWALDYLPGLSAYPVTPVGQLPTLAAYNTQEADVPTSPSTPVFQWSVGLQGGASAALRSLQTEAPDAQELLELRQRTEQSLEVLHAGLRLGGTHRSGFGLHTGLQWTRLAERMEFRDEMVKFDTVYGIMALAVNPFGDTTAIYGQVPHTTTTNMNKRYYNYYQLIDLPLLASYQQQAGKWWLGAEAGVYMNLRLRSSGQILQPDYSGLDLADAQPELFPNRIGLSYHLGLRASRELWPGVQVSVSPQWRFLPTLSAADNPIRQRYQLFGLQVGVVFEL